VVARGEIWLASLDPTVGSEIRKSRPCVVISPPEMHDHLRTVIVAPMTTTRRSYPSRIPVAFAGKNGDIALDQIRTIDKDRIVKRLGTVPAETAETLCAALIEMFSYQSER
jgi:mRNA interferase MazF